MTDERNWDSIGRFIQSGQRFIITTHANPDGDAIGSQIALSAYLKQLGKEVHLINSDPTPKFFQFLDPEGTIEVFDENRHADLIRGLDGGIVLDISDWGRLRRVGEILRGADLPLASIDHHIPTDLSAKYSISDQSASSTGEMLYDFFATSQITMNKEIVNALYTCILTDTGSFRFSNTTPRTHQIAAALLKSGAEFREIYEKVYESYSKNRTILKGLLLANMHFECKNRIAWFVLTQELLRKTGAEAWETDGFSELPRNVENVEVCIMFAEKETSITKVSFRSKGRIAVSDLAQKFGGGGHKFASGVTLSMDLQQATEKIIHEAIHLVENHR